MHSDRVLRQDLGLYTHRAFPASAMLGVYALSMQLTVQRHGNICTAADQPAHHRK